MPRVGPISLRRVAATAVVASLVMMFAVPLATMTNRWVYDAFLAAEYEASMDMVRASKNKIAPEADISPETVPAEPEPSENVQPAPHPDDAPAPPANAAPLDAPPDTPGEDAPIMDSPYPYPFQPETPGETPTEEGESILETLRNALNGANEAMDLRGRIESLRQMLDEVMDSIVNLIVVFVLNSVVFPLLFLWVLVVLVKRLGRMALEGGRAGKPA